MSRLRDLARREEGVAAIEFAIIGLLLIVVSIGTIEIGRALFLYNELAHAADRAARLILITPDIGDDDLAAQVRENFLTGLAPEDLDVIPGNVVDSDSGIPIAFRTVRLAYPFTPMVTGLTLGSFTMTTDRRVPAGT